MVTTTNKESPMALSLSELKREVESLQERLAKVSEYL
jgi:hypothetical protein